jgi:DNA polymerase-3 subunit gamma/tau
MRDAISLLELCAGGGRGVTPDVVNETVGSTGREGTMQMAVNIANKNYDAIFADIAQTVRSSKDLYIFIRDMLSLWRDLLVFKTLPDPSLYLDLTDREKKTLAELSSRYTRETLLWQSGLLEAASVDMLRPGASKRTTAELTLMKMCDEQLDSSNEALLSRISKLETAMVTGQISPAPIPELKKEEPAEKKIEKEAKETTPEPEPKKAEATAPPEPKKADGKRRVLRSFAEIVERISKSDQLSASFLKSAKAVTEGETLTVYLASDFAKSFVNTPDTLAAITAAAASLTGKNYTLKLDVGVPDAAAEEEITDEILDNAEEF